MLFMTREKAHRLTIVKSFVDVIHKYQLSTNNSLFQGSPRYGVSRMTIPEFDLTFDRSVTRGWPVSHDTWDMEISTPELLVSIQVTNPINVWVVWADLATQPKSKWTFDSVGDLGSLSDVELWLKLNWPIDSE